MVAIFGFNSVKNIRIDVNFNRDLFSDKWCKNNARNVSYSVHRCCDVSICFSLNSKAKLELGGVGYTQRSCENLGQMYNRKVLKVIL